MLKFYGALVFLFVIELMRYCKYAVFRRQGTVMFSYIFVSGVLKSLYSKYASVVHPVDLN